VIWLLDGILLAHAWRVLLASIMPESLQAFPPFMTIWLM
jgi:hypothetical protein